MAILPILKLRTPFLSAAARPVTDDEFKPEPWPTSSRTWRRQCMPHPAWVWRPHRWETAAESWWPISTETWTRTAAMSW